MKKMMLPAGAILAFLGVAAGAFGAHILKNHLDSEMLAVFETAVRYQMYHAIALVLTGMLAVFRYHKRLTIIGWLFITGIILFSGSLYVLSLTGIKAFGIITPFGGIAFLAGWAWLAVAGIKESVSIN
jgi:uncharacterized membrane protein YgdD (TMEM256/DUF423 family)